METISRMSTAFTQHSDEQNGQAPGHPTIDFLVRRMKHESDFPTFSQHIIEINEKTSPSSGNYASATELANTILKDYSLTSKLLRLVNSVYYSQLAGKITTVSRAVVVLGFEQVRLAAASILLFEHLNDKGQRSELKEEAIKAFMSGLIAKEIGGRLGIGELEEAFICAMLHNLGKLLVIFYLPKEYEHIKEIAKKNNLDERIASREVLGVSYKELGKAIASVWRFPEKILSTMQEMPKGKVTAPKSDEDLYYKLSAFSNELCGLMSEEEDLAEATKTVVKKYRDCFEISKEILSGVYDSVNEKIGHYSNVLGFDVEASPFLKKLARYGDTSKINRDEKGIRIIEPGDEGGNEFPGSEKSEELLIAGIEDISNSLLGDFELRDVLTMILETMYRGFHFNRVIFCMPNTNYTKMIARLGFGKDIDKILENFRFSMASSQDVFGLSISLGKDIRIDDSRSLKMEKRIPQWYRKSIYAPAFVLFPVYIKKKAAGLFYADKNKTGKVIEDAQINYMRTLRNQAALALRQLY